MKQVVALLGSNRKKNTYGLLMEIKSILKQYQIELTIIELYRQKITPCLGCERCILQGECVLRDDTEYVMKQLCEADGIILASPVYLQQVSGQLKTFLDRTCMWYHRPVLAGKPVLTVVTTKGSGLHKTMSYLENIAVQWGAVPAGTVGRSIFTQEKHVLKKEVSRFLKLMEQPQKHSPTLKQLIHFEVQKAMAMSLNLPDRQYWMDRHWCSQSYFYSCKINPVYGFISRQIGKFLQYKMRDAGQ